MKKQISFLSLLFISFLSISAQKENIEAGTMFFNIGAGLGTTNNYIYKNASVSPTFTTSFERLFLKAGPGHISLGGQLEYQTASISENQLEFSFKSLFLGGRLSYYPEFLSNKTFHAYGSFILGYFSNSTSSANTFSSGMGIGVVAGARMIITEKFGLFTEIGYDLAPIKLGGTFKF